MITGFQPRDLIIELSCKETALKPSGFLSTRCPGSLRDSNMQSLQSNAVCVPNAN